MRRARKRITRRLFALALLTAALGGGTAAADGATVQRGHVRAPAAERGTTAAPGG